ncbi:MAG: biotin carboxylase N-terminal domain-containing protein [Acidobacteriota bacterium]|nr:biotin carboxylase N-terminal domain-containing protein [Acidobacteriota bacterium]
MARRIFRSAHAMGISTVAVYADGDADAPFASEADEAIALGGRTSAETYLNAEKVLGAAARTAADGIHPGYGFLAENAAFAKAVVDAGLIWVGPSPEAITAMGDKLSAKALMREAQVPTLPAAELGGDDEIRAAAEGIGYPVLVKASAGGGGKGMRVVTSPDDIEEAVAAARREAQASFGDDTVFLERWLDTARHVEIQLLGDEHGNVVHCFERECSIQRRHQKIIEEAPSPAVTSALRAKMGDAAVAAGKAIGYSSAGTVEFLLDGDEFWFLEVNTRLQVEHPVTEEITGLDLVREQLRVAQGEELGFSQDDLGISGHSIEVRLYAEDPSNGFLPTIGTVAAWQPPAGLDVRYDSGIATGSEVGIEFDPMLAKVISHAPTRREAAGKLARALEQTRIQGVVTNRDFLVTVLRSPEYLAGDTTTDFIERVDPPRTRPATIEALGEAGILAVMAAQYDRRAQAKVLTTLASGWRNTVMPPEDVSFVAAGDVEGEAELTVEYRVQRGGSFHASYGQGDHVVEPVSRCGDDVTVVVDGRRVTATVTIDGDHHHVHGPDGDITLVEQPRFPSADLGGVAGGLVAPMPGKVLAVHISSGAAVDEGQLLLVLEAMKMEHRITAPQKGFVTELRVSEGDQVGNGELLVVLSEEEEAAE